MKTYQLAQRSLVLAMAISVTLGATTFAANYHRGSGLTISNQFLPTKGVKIKKVDRGSHADDADLERGDLIVGVINSNTGFSAPIKDVDTLLRVLDDVAADTIHLAVKPGGNGALVDVELALAGRNGPEPVPDLNGVWHSTLGTTTLTRNNDSISGMIDYPFAGSAQINGTVNGNTIAYTWVSQNPNGAGQGQLTIAADGRSIRGLWVNVLDNTGGEWMLWR